MEKWKNDFIFPPFFQMQLIKCFYFLPILFIFCSFFAHFNFFLSILDKWRNGKMSSFFLHFSKCSSLNVVIFRPFCPFFPHLFHFLSIFSLFIPFFVHFYKWTNVHCPFSICNFYFRALNQKSRYFYHKSLYSMIDFANINY